MNRKQEKVAKQGRGRALFMRRALKSPRQMAALGPSTAAVSMSVAEQVDLTRNGIVLELGGGTGSITQALLEVGVPADRLVVVERYPEMCELLRERFPGLQVIQGDVLELKKLADEAGLGEVGTVVSSVPVVWLSLKEQSLLVDQVFSLMEAGGRLVQLTYSPLSPLPKKKLGLEGKLVARQMLSAPPAAVWTYWKA